jgi:hypothetical protein
MQKRKTTPALIAFCLSAALASSSFAESPTLPDNAPIPEENAQATTNGVPQRGVDVPVPEPRPGEAAQPENEAEQPAETPANAPLPQEAPAGQKLEAMPAETVQPASPPDPRSAQSPALQMPIEEMACRQRLQTLGVSFQNRPAEADVSGCAMPYPMSVKMLGGGVAIKPEALMNCAMAEAAARFTSEVIAPAAKRDFGTELKSISQASAYVCRPRNGTTKLSEHAFGNALDIASFKLADDKVVEVVLRPDEQAARFLGALRKAACGPFKTVLGPGSNADHATHFHVDLAPRRQGGTVCE